MTTRTTTRKDTPTARGIHLYRHLLQHGRITTAQAARLTGVGPRVVRQDLQLLMEIAPVSVLGTGIDRVWVLDPAHGADHLGVLDRLSLRLGREVTAFLGGTGLHDAMERVGAGGREELPARFAAHLDRKIRHLQEPARSYAEHREVLDTVLDGLLRERRLDFRYQHSTTAEWHRDQEPLTLTIYRRAVYLMARGPEETAVRRYAVERIVEVEAGAPFVYPPEWDPDADLNRYFGIHATGLPARVVVRFDAEVRRLVLARRWHPTAEVVELEDGRVEVRMYTSGIELIRWVLEWGRRAEVIEPAWLKEKVMEELTVALGRYP